LDLYGGYLPSAAQRWCTKKLKLDPFEKFFGDDKVINYVGIRADENRMGYLSTSDKVTTVFPFVEDNIDKNGVLRILNESGVGYPSYYSWRSRSGCYFCFFQRKEEWVGLKERHPQLFDQAKAYEVGDFKWRQDMRLSDLDDDETVKRIKQEAEKKIEGKRKLRPGATLIEVLDEVHDEDDIEKPCLICHL
jgi:3'-phosphoadenosine 5'-phosphosulfate sulfotransferase (PAPS reductase)/FAD synthetase